MIFLKKEDLCLRREYLVNLRNELKNCNNKKYCFIAAFDCINDKIVEQNNYIYDYVLQRTDQSKQLAFNITKSLEEIIEAQSINSKNFETVKFLIIPKLFYDIDTVTLKEAAIVDNENVEYENKHVAISVVFLAIVDGKICEVPDIYLDGIVDYNNFYNIMTSLGFYLPYSSIDELSTDILKSALKDSFPNFEVSIDDEPKAQSQIVLSRPKN